MAVDSSIDVRGVAETMKLLRRLDPEARKEFDRGIRTVVAPMVTDAKGAYPAMPLSGWARAWAPGGRPILPWSQARVKSGVRVKSSTRRGASSVVYVTQATPAGTVFEVTKAANPMGSRVRARSSKVLWPAYDRHAAQITAGVAELVERAERTVAQAEASWR